MANRNTDILFQLIHSLEKAEKRNFKLYIKRNSSRDDLKIVRLFDALDKMDDYDEAILLKKLKDVEKPQLANLKTHLYKELLASLRDLKSSESIELQLNEQLDYARILYNKGLFQQSLRFLEKAKEIGFTYGKYNFLSQVISLEKKIETLFITRSMRERSEKLAEEAIEVSGHIYRVFLLSNLAVKLYSFYIENGHARNRAEEKEVIELFTLNMPPQAKKAKGFYELLYLYQSYTWFAFIRQDFLMYYRYSKKWVDLFETHPIRIRVETAHYIKGLHNLLNAHFDLRNFKAFRKALESFEKFQDTPVCQQHENFRVHTFIYIMSAKINWHLMTGTFKDGLKLIPELEDKLQGFGQQVDQHRIMVFNYKIAMLYFGSGDHSRSIDYLQNIINQPVDLRYDLQAYARLVHLMAHYELGNYDLTEYLSKSVYRFMAKMKNLTVVEEEIFRFLKTSFRVSSRQLKPELEKLLSNIKHLEKNRFETRAFAYLDIISWVESKVYGKSMEQVIFEKYQASRHK
ncbi:MAG: hypothetical protein MUE99_07865 [Chitinophagaceae bacterium]|jgi:hypothetical protein|nr:hypothetical protein [Chitinophagaceae bacterium]